MKFSLVIPCYNEADNLPHLLESCRELAMRPGVEVIFVDNGSTDGTKYVLANLLPKYPGCISICVDENRGYGYGIMSGLRVAKGEILGWTHADMQTDPCDALKALEIFERHGSEIFVKGKRYGRPLLDIVFTFAMSIFETLLLKKPMWDINAQPTIFSRKFLDTFITPPNDFSLDLYAYYKAKLSKLKVYRFSVKFGPRLHGQSHWNFNWESKKKFIHRTIDFSFQLKRTFKNENNCS